MKNFSLLSRKSELAGTIEREMKQKSYINIGNLLTFLVVV